VDMGGGIRDVMECGAP